MSAPEAQAVGPLNIIFGKTLLHIETDANHPHGAGRHVCSLSKKDKGYAYLLVQSVNERPALLAQNEALRKALESISERCPHKAERAEGGLSDYGGNADDMAADYRETSLSDIGDTARAALAQTKGVV